jgi:outer membrane receptor protein involved in Fe transport
VIRGPIAIGPLPLAEGAASNAGLSHGIQAEASLQAPLGVGWQGSFAAYYRDTRYAVDFGLVDLPFASPCDPSGTKTPVYRDIDVRAMGVEAMVRRELGRSVTGWLSYSLGKIDRDFGFIRLPHDYDQRHTVSATAQWRLTHWTLGGSVQAHTGRPAEYPDIMTCDFGGGSSGTEVLQDPTRLRRLPISWRIDLRAEREVQLAGRRARVYFEMQNASLTSEALGYDLHTEYPPVQLGEIPPPPKYSVSERTLFLPVPMIGVEVDL